jgi:hypothetical protein
MSTNDPMARVITHRRALVRITREITTEAPGAPGRTHTWRVNDQHTLWQLSRRPAVALDPATDRWWTDFDIALAHILPADAVEVLEVLSQRTEPGAEERGGDV